MKPEKREIGCPVCGGKTYRVKYEPWVDIDDPVRLYGAATSICGTQRIVACSDCGMIYENPRFPDDVILAGYETSQEAGHDSQYPMRVKSFYRCLKSLGKYIPPKGAKILDVGTAGGAFLEAAQQFGYDAAGLEPSKFLVEQGVKRGLKISHGTIDSHSFQATSFDMVCMWDVIEHLTDPKSALKKTRPLLKPDGVLLVNYPDIGTLMARFAGKRYWWLLSGHLHYFTQKSITRLCEKTGFDRMVFRMYWQTLEFGYLQYMTAHYKIPGAKLFKQITPQFIQQIPMSYYASQTTLVARVKQ